MANSATGHNKDENVIAFDAYNQAETPQVSKTVAARNDQDTASCVAKYVASVAPTLNAGGNKTGGDRPYGTSVDTCEALLVVPIGVDLYNGTITGEVAATFGASGGDVNHSGPKVMQPVTFEWQRGATQNMEFTTDISPALIKSQTPAVMQPLPFDTTQVTSPANPASEDGTGMGTPLVPISFGAQMSVPQVDFDMAQTLQAKNPTAVAYGFREDNTARTLTARYDSSPCVDRGPDVVAFPIDTQNMTEGHASGGKGFGEHGDPSFTLTKGHSHAVAFQSRIARNGRGQPEEICPTLNGLDAGATSDMRPLVAQPFSIMPMNSGKDYKARPTDVAQPLMAGGPVGGNQGGDFIAETWAVRRLTPTECERLQGFPDNYTAIPWGKKTADECPDGPRYKAVGNSMAVPVMRWIGERIQLVDDFISLF